MAKKKNISIKNTKSLKSLAKKRIKMEQEVGIQNKKGKKRR